MSTKAGDQSKSRIPRHAGGAFNPRKATAPIAAFTMACILYAYSVSSIRAAKRNAQLHREADGGQVDMRKESLRRHGVLEKVEGTRSWELYRDGRAEHQKETDHMGANTGNASNLDGARDEQTPTSTRTEVESALQGYKGVGAAAKRFKQDNIE